jgi:hypothetical protein
MIQGIHRHPTWSGMVIVPTGGPMGDGQVLPETPELTNLIREQEMTAAMSTTLPLKDRARLADFLRENPSDRSPRAFGLWATQHQVPVRECIAIKLSADERGLNLDAMTFEPHMKSRTFHPNGMESEMAVPLVEREEDYDENDTDTPTLAASELPHLKVSGSDSLRKLQRIGLLKRHMSPAQLAARLVAVGMEEHDRNRKLAAMELRRFCKANGSVWPIRKEDAPLKGYLPAGRVGNASTSRAVHERELLASVARLQAHQAQVAGPAGRTMTGRAAEGC